MRITHLLLTILITGRIIRPRIFTVLPSISFLAIPFTTAITAIMGIGVTTGTTEFPVGR